MTALTELLQKERDWLLAKLPPYERLLNGVDAKKATVLQAQSDAAEQEDKYDEAIRVGAELLELREVAQGTDHWETLKQVWAVDGLRTVSALPAAERATWRSAVRKSAEARQLEAKGQSAKAQLLWEDYRGSCERVFGLKHPWTAASYNNLAYSLNAQGKYADAQRLNERALVLSREFFGERHPSTAGSYNNLALNLSGQGKPLEAQPLYEKALQLRLELHGEKHNDTGSSYNNVAFGLYQLGRPIDAEPYFRKALAIYVELLGEKHGDSAMAYSNLASNLDAQGKYADAQALHQKALAVRRDVLGEEHPHVAMSYNNLALNLHSQAKYADAEPHFQNAVDRFRKLLGENHPNVPTAINNLALNLSAQGKHAEAHSHFKTALDLRRKLLGENHADTAVSYGSVASNLSAQAKHSDAQPLYHKALDLHRALLGEKHPSTANWYNNLAHNLREQGKHSEAQPLYQRFLDVYRERLGEHHPTTAIGYNNLAVNLYDQGKYANAQTYLRKALEASRAMLGERHPNTALAYNNLASNLDAQGRYADAHLLYQRSLKLYRELLGEKHAQTALIYNNLAHNCDLQNRHADAQVLYETSLHLRRELLGEKHPDVGTTYNNMAANLDAREKYADAQLLYQRSLDLRRERLGENHPDVGTSYNNLATNLLSQGKHVEAQSLFQKALDLRLALFGERHLSTSTTYTNYAGNQMVQGKYAEAQKMLMKAVAGYETARLTATTRGLDRGVFGHHSPYQFLAATQARLGSAAPAWIAAESDLSRGLGDELASRRPATLTVEEQGRQASLNARLNQLQPGILELVAKVLTADSEIGELARRLNERRTLEAELSELAVAVSQREVASLPELQRVLPTDAALVQWVDISVSGVEEHWGCVIRRNREPSWEQLTGTGPGGRWTSDDSALPEQLRTALAAAGRGLDLAGPTGTGADVDSLAKRLRAQRLAPLAKHLDGASTLYVVAVNRMAGVPMEALTRDYTISYVPSGTFLARVKEKAPPAGDRLLALGDPVFKDVAAKPQAVTEVPSNGLLLLQVLPDGAAAKAGLHVGDVLVRYGDVELSSVERLAEAIEAHAAAKEIPITVWREGVEKPIVCDVPPGKLGVGLSREPAREAIKDRRQTDALLLSLRGGVWKQLPGTRAEVAQAAMLFGANATTLLDSAASEQSLDEFRRSGNLSKFRYVHLATHGKANNVRAFESVLILAQDALPEDALPRAGEPLLNGQLSANEVLEFWKLDAELVTLSACETAIGPSGGGDGLLGFAQAFLTAGSRAVCLSLWKVDDTATALLMTRFYQNLLGRRPGLDRSMPKAKALAEAKRWLRELPATEAQQLIAEATRAIALGERADHVNGALKLVIPGLDPQKPADADVKPFAHPRYWSAFVLIGDPD